MPEVNPEREVLIRIVDLFHNEAYGGLSLLEKDIFDILCEAGYGDVDYTGDCRSS